jgi:hypothetical protein
MQNAAASVQEWVRCVRANGMPEPPERALRASRS